MKTRSPFGTDQLFDDEHYSRRFHQKIMRAILLGPSYYLYSLPRYFFHSAKLKIPFFDFQALFSPLKEFSGYSNRFALPPNVLECANIFNNRNIKISMPPNRFYSLLGAWWATKDAEGDIIEFGSYTGHTFLFLGLLMKLNGLKGKKIHLLDTFKGIPATSNMDSLRYSGEFYLPPGHLGKLKKNAYELGLENDFYIHEGLFHETATNLIKENEKKHFSFAHIDANIFSSTNLACKIINDKIAKNGIVVFDDFNGPCDLGARLAILANFPKDMITNLSGSSAYLLNKA